MVNNKTYNNVVNTLLRLGEYHEQISTTSVGDIYDINLEKMHLKMAQKFLCFQLQIIQRVLFILKIQ